MDIFEQLLLLMVVVWSVAVLLRRLGLPTIMGELLMGIVVGPAVLGWIHPSEVIEVLAEMGIFFLMLHTGVETAPREFFSALKSSLGIALVGAIVPFAVSFGIALGFGLPMEAAVFVGLTMTATAVVITLKILRDLGLHNTSMARVVVASCVIDDLLTLVLFSMVLSIQGSAGLDLLAFVEILAKVLMFFGVSLAIGYYIYPKFTHPFRDPKGKSFTFLLILGLSAGLFAEAIGLHIILGAYLAGLFFEEKVADAEIVAQVTDRLYAIGYSFLGPIFFISLGFHINFNELGSSGWLFIVVLTVCVLVGQIVSAGGMAKAKKFNWLESLTVGVGMCGRAEMAFILAAIGLERELFDSEIFTILIVTAFMLNLLTSVGLKGCAVLLLRRDRQAPAVLDDIS